MKLPSIFGNKDKIDSRGFSVIENENEKVLVYNGITYSKIKKNSVYTREYWDFFLPIAYAFDRPKVLLIGVGGGTVAYQLVTLLKENVTVDAIDLSPKAIEIAKGFALPSSVNTMVGEGSEYVAKTSKKYDAIMVDAYISSSIPGQFTGLGFIGDAYRALSDDGILAVNYAVGMMGIFRMHDFVARLKEQGFRVFSVSTAFFEGNIILICSKVPDPGKLLDRIRQRMQASDDNMFLLRSYESMKEL